MATESTAKPVRRRVGDRLSCLTSGHLWTEARMTIGETQLMRFECRRCGAIGSVRLPTERRNNGV